MVKVLFWKPKGAHFHEFHGERFKPDTPPKVLLIDNFLNHKRRIGLPYICQYFNIARKKYNDSKNSVVVMNINLNIVFLSIKGFFNREVKNFHQNLLFHNMHFSFIKHFNFSTYCQIQIILAFVKIQQLLFRKNLF